MSFSGIKDKTELDRAFIDAMRETLRYAPLYGSQEALDLERFGQTPTHYVMAGNLGDGNRKIR